MCRRVRLLTGPLATIDGVGRINRKPKMKFKCRTIQCLGGALLTTLALAAPAAPLQIAAAADLAVCMQELNATFSAAHDSAEVKSSVGSSGNFFAQISNGAPFDVFLSADLDYPRALASAGYAELTTLVVYAHGQLVMITTDAALPIADGFKLFNDARIHRIAIANPEVAPYGRAARAALQHESIWTSLQPRLVFGENVAQTAQFVVTGNAQLGLVGRIHMGKLDRSVPPRFWIVPSAWYPTILQGGIVTVHGKDNPLARQYLKFLRSTAGREILGGCGFTLPDLEH